jgi:RNA polymerase sigma-70 factor (ECF subfamily)
MKPTVSRNENACFRRVAMPYLDEAYELAHWLAGNRADAEDIIQEACLGASRGVGDFSEGDARCWTMTIVRATAHRWLQKNRPHALFHVADLEGSENTRPNESHDETPDATLMAVADAKQLGTMIAALPAPFRETIVLCDIQGFSYREIALVTGAPIHTVMSRLARARHTLLVAVAPRQSVATQ